MYEIQFKNFDDVIAKAKNIDGFTICVAVAHDEDVLTSIKMAEEINLRKSLLFGDREKIEPLAEQLGLNNYKIFHEPDDFLAAKKAAKAVADEQADVLMKGLVNSSVFLRAVLDADNNLKSRDLLSHLAAYDIPGQSKVVFMTDGGININPDINQKKSILNNAISALAAIGITDPKIALLAANESVNSKMPSTVDAQLLIEMRKSGEIPAGVLEGPIALDVAVSHEAALHKGIKSQISEIVDLFFVPNIEAGNLMGKTLIYYANAKMAGLVLGAKCPIVLTSRAETAQGKLCSIALAGLMTAIQ